MVSVICRSNLDDTNREQWPTSMPARPMVGDLIRSAVNWGSGDSPRYLELEVVAVTWVPVMNSKSYVMARGLRTYQEREWILEVELNLSRTRAMQISQQFGGDWHRFYSWFKQPRLPYDANSVDGRSV